MLKVDPSRRTRKFLKILGKGNPKHGRQIAEKIEALREPPNPPDCKLLKGKGMAFLRADAGEYRIVYRVVGDTLHIALVGKRNDDEIYRILMRMKDK